MRSLWLARARFQWAVDGVAVTTTRRSSTRFVLKPGQHGSLWAAVDGDNYAEANFELTNKLQPS